MQEVFTKKNKNVQNLFEWQEECLQTSKYHP